MRNVFRLGYPNSRITSAAQHSYRTYNSTARRRCSLAYLAMARLLEPPVQENGTTSNLRNRRPNLRSSSHNLRTGVLKEAGRKTLKRIHHTPKSLEYQGSCWCHSVRHEPAFTTTMRRFATGLHKFETKLRRFLLGLRRFTSRLRNPTTNYRLAVETNKRQDALQG